MTCNKNRKKGSSLRRILSLALLTTAGVLLLGAGTVFADDPPSGKFCAAGSYSKTYNKCIGQKDASGACPTGLKPDGSLPAPNNCSTGLSDGTATGTVRFTTGNKGKFTCGKGDQVVHISINIGCKGEKGNIESPIIDIGFAVVRVLSIGAGLIVIGSIAFAGVQYSSAKGDPQATAAAIKRIRSSLYALMIYIFSAAILNFIIPAGFFR